ncbi:hypothetical protein ACN47E_002868 [Coniothyrium glycines]
MKSSPAQIMAVVLLWALAVFALPPDSNFAPGFSTLATESNPNDALLGINCRGSAMCSGQRCEISLTELRKMVDGIDDNKEYVNGNQIACAKCPHCRSDDIDCPFPASMGICVFPQRMKNGEKIKARDVKVAIKNLDGHGCKRCGSCPIHPGNNVNDGEITINYTMFACDGSKPLCKVGDLYKKWPVGSVAEGPAPVSTLAVRPRTDVSPRWESPENGPLLGINCRGSGRCASCSVNINEIRASVNTINDATQFSNGQLIACNLCQHCSNCGGSWQQGLCAFAQNMKADEKISAKRVKEQLKATADHGCNRCGSSPIHPGNDVSTGQVTVNYVSENHGCDGVCASSSFLNPADMALVNVASSHVDPLPIAPATSPRSHDPASARGLLGINCKGSSRCGSCADASLAELVAIVDRMGDFRSYGPGEKIACAWCRIQDQGRVWPKPSSLCVFAQGIGSGRITLARVKVLMHKLRDNNCEKCGSVPIYDGGDGGQGELTVNFVLRGCGASGACS